MEQSPSLYKKCQHYYYIKNYYYDIMLILALLLFYACVHVLHKTSIEKKISSKMQGITVTDIVQSGDQGHTLCLPQWMFP